MAKLNIVLYEPEIPANTGNIGRHRVVLGIDIEHIANDKVGAVLLLGLDEILDGVWFQQVVRIGEEDEIAGGGVQASVASRRRTAVFAVQHPDAGIPRSPGITHFGANLYAICRACRCRKRNRPS